MDIISLKDVKKIYTMGNEKIYAVNGVDLNIAQGEICCLLGKSGSGKSTLLNLISGLEKPSTGEIVFMGKHIESMDESALAAFRQKYIGFVFQQYNLLPTLTAAENVALPLIFKGIAQKERMDRAREMLKAVGLEERCDHKPNQMSGGQQQRVSIARAFINNPEVVFADEPTGNLDTKTTYEMMDLILDLSQKNNQTIIMVTHDLEISGYADRIIHLHDGKIDKIEINENKITQGSYTEED